MTISFNEVPIDIRVPGQYIEIDNSKAYQGLSGIPTKVLVIGQMLSAGSATPLEPLTITSADQAVSLFGAGSQLAHMLEKSLGTGNLIEIHGIAQEDDDAGVAATGTITIGGSPTASGTLSLYVGGRRVRIAVSSTDTASTIATALAAAIEADDNLSISAAVNGGTSEQIDITAKNAGVEANYINCQVNYYEDESLPSGVTVTIVQLSGGSGNPDISDVIDAIGDEWYTDIVMAYSDTTNIVAIEAELESRFGPLKMIDGHCYIGVADTYANLITKGSDRNSPHVSIIGAKGSPTPPYEWAAVLGAQAAFYGKQDPARPFQTLELKDILPPKIADRFTLEEKDLLLRGGISTFTVDTGGIVRIERVITTYRENAFGADDTSYLDLNTLKTLTYLRYDLRTFIAIRYPRYKLADDGTKFARGQAVVTPNVIRASIIARFLQWEEIGLVENIEQFKEDLIVERDGSDVNRVNALVPPDIVNQLRVFAGLVQFRL